MEQETPWLYLITGLMAAGKSTVAQALAQRLPRSVHLRGDLFRRLIVRGQAEMGFELTPEAEAQLHLRYQIAASVARHYLDAGFSVVYQDIILGQTLERIIRQLAAFPYPLHLVVLCPDAATVAAREAGRGKVGYGDLSISDFDRVLREETPRFGFWLDSSALTVEETVDALLAGRREVTFS